MKKKTITGQILTTAEIRRIQEEIADDTKLREDASERIAANKAKLDKHDAAVSRRATTRPAVRKKTIYKPIFKRIKTIVTPPPPGAAVPLPAKPGVAATPAKLPKGGGSVGIVLEVVRAHPQGLAAPDVRRMAAGHPHASKSIAEHGQYVYSVLETLATREQVEKGADGKWRPKATH